MKTIFFILVIVPSIVIGQIVPFTSEQWKFQNKDYGITNYLGKEALLLKKNSAILEGANFENGIIEYDMAFPDGRAFIGFQFRMEDEKNYEEFYIRPHQSGNPDANQYTPVFGSNAGWQLYHGEGYGAPVKYNFNRWVHFKLLVSGKYLEVYIDDMSTPILFAELKRQPFKGNVGIANPINESYFANVSITHDDNVTLKGKAKPTESVTKGTVEKWSVSQAFSEKNIIDLVQLKDLKAETTYKQHSVEATGTLNLSAVAQLGENSNTVLAKVTVQSNTAQFKKLSFGFSDRVTVFVNGTAVYRGEDNFVSRDYRFLGTIGYFDTIFVPLKKGKNEIVFAVSENFGGWGIKARFNDTAGIEFVY